MEQDENEQKKEVDLACVGGSLVWMFETSAVFVIYLCPVVYFGAFDAKRMIYTAESWLTEAELISVHACLFMHTGRENDREKLSLTSLIKHWTQAWLPASQSAHSGSGIHTSEQRERERERETKTYSDDTEIRIVNPWILVPGLSSNRVSNNNYCFLVIFGNDWPPVPHRGRKHGKKKKAVRFEFSFTDNCCLSFSNIQYISWKLRLCIGWNQKNVEVSWIGTNTLYQAKRWATVYDPAKKVIFCKKWLIYVDENNKLFLDSKVER